MNLKGTKTFIAVLGVALAAPVFIPQSAVAAKRAPVRRVVVNGVEYMLAGGRKSLSFRLEGPAEVSVKVRPLVGRGREKSREFHVSVAVGSQKKLVRVPALKAEKGVSFSGLRNTVPAQEFVVLEGEPVKTRLIHVKITPGATCLVRVEKKPLTLPERKVRPAPLVKKGGFLPGLSLSFIAGPVYYYNTTSSYDSAGLRAGAFLRYKLLSRLSADSSLIYHYYRTGYLYMKRQVIAWKPVLLLLNENRLTLNAGASYLILKTGLMRLSAGGGYTYDGYYNSVMPLHFHGIYGRAGVELNLMGVSVLTGACLAFRLGGTTKSPSLEGLPAMRLGIPVSVEIPVGSAPFSLKAGYSFEYVEFEQGRRLYNTLLVSVGI